VTRIPAQGRLPVEDSLFDRLRELRPDLPVLRATKATMAASSHLIETLVHQHADRCLLVSGFQHGRHWAAERDRYLELAGENDVIAVFAGREPLGADVDHVGLRLRTGDPLAQEWFVLALGPGLAITLCGLDGTAHSAAQAPVLEADRLFEVVWSVQPAVAAVAAEVVLEAVRRSAPEQARAVAVRLSEVAGYRPPSAQEAAAAADVLLSGMVGRMEQLRLREKRRLAAASQSKSLFLSRMSHELRTPLNAILGFSQLLELDAQDDDTRESVEQILSAGRHLVGLVDEILDISRIEAGELDLRVESVAVSDVVGEVLAMIDPLAQARGLVVRDLTAADDDGPAEGGAGLVQADRERLRQVLVNLVANAVKYNREGGVLTVALSRTPDAARIAVTDTGPGMTSDQVERLFTPFERLDAATSGISGSGLGLVVALQLVEAMGGQIEVDSRPGVGSTFTVALPRPDRGEGSELV
jgi:signal transduction histidine kinase